MKIGSLFAGIGGFDLAAQWMGWETSWYSEIEPYASGVMKKQFPHATNLGDITRIDGKSAAPVDLLCGGFPCQDISLAGKGVGIEGSRSGLWSHYSRLIDEIRPRWVVAENVSALRSRGLDRVLKDLMALASRGGEKGNLRRRSDLGGAESTLPDSGSGVGRSPDSRNPTDVWITEPDVGRVAHGVPARVDRLRCLGNAIVPQVAYLLFQAIDAEDRRVRA